MVRSRPQRDPRDRIHLRAAVNPSRRVTIARFLQALQFHYHGTPVVITETREGRQHVLQGSGHVQGRLGAVKVPVPKGKRRNQAMES